jgi:hypothetical protein
MAWADIEKRKAYYANNKEKMKEYDKKWRADNPEKVTERRKQYTIDNKEKISEVAKQWRVDNPEKAREISNQHSRRYNDELTSSSVARRLGLNLKTAPKELIELKRLQLLITREIRAKKC